jgi:hypothetical protein
VVTSLQNLQKKQDVEELYTGRPLASVSQYLAETAPPTTTNISALFGRFSHTVQTWLHEISFRNVQDAWNDEHLINFLRFGSISALKPWEKERVTRRSQNYKYQDDKLYFMDKTKKVLREVPLPENRLTLVKKAHEKSGHYGIRKTYSRLSDQYYWAGMYLDVEQHVKSCGACVRLRAAFSRDTPNTLQSLPILGLFFRWHVDLAGPFPIYYDDQHNKVKQVYLFVAVEAFTRWIEVKVIPYKTAECTSEACKELILSRYGSPAQIVTDRGPEWRAEFDQLLFDNYIDHAITRGYHPQSNGAVEKIVGILKVALRKTLVQKARPDWMKALMNVIQGYRMSRQSSTKFSPYLLLFGRSPVIPSGFQNVANVPIDWSDQKAAEQSLIARAKLFEQCVPMAMANSLIAQHRDTKRYERRYDKNTGVYRSATEIKVGDFVYYERQAQSTLQMQFSPSVLLVVMILPNETLILQGKNGTTSKTNKERVGMCHLPNLSVEVSRKEDDEIHQDHPCEVCRLTTQDAQMLLCDICSTGWHLQCLTKHPRLYPQFVSLEKDYNCQYCKNVGRSQTIGNYNALELKEHLNEYMPGNWTSNHVKKLVNRMDGSAASPLEYLKTTIAEYKALMELIKIPEKNYIWDPFGGDATALREIFSSIQPIYTNDINAAAMADTHSDATKWAYYETFLANQADSGVLITSPPFSLLDVILPMLIDKMPSQMLLCFHVGPNYLSDGPLPRHQYLQNMLQSVNTNHRDLHVIHGMPRNNSGHRGQWLILFPDGATGKFTHASHNAPAIGRMTFSSPL